MHARILRTSLHPFLLVCLQLAERSGGQGAALKFGLSFNFDFVDGQQVGQRCTHNPVTRFHLPFTEWPPVACLTISSQFRLSYHMFFRARLWTSVPLLTGQLFLQNACTVFVYSSIFLGYMFLHMYHLAQHSVAHTD